MKHFAFPITLGLLLASSGIQAAEVNVWSQTMIRQDALVSKNGKKIDLMFFDRDQGDFSLEFDSATRKVTKFSGAFRKINKKVFALLEKRASTLQGRQGVKKATAEKVFYMSNGKSDRIFKFDITPLNIQFDPAAYASLLTANSAIFSIKAKRSPTGGIEIYVGMEFNENETRHEMALLNWTEMSDIIYLAQAY